MIDVLKQMVEALELNNSEWKELADSGDAGYWTAEEQDHYKQTEEAIKAGKQAISELESQEPDVVRLSNGTFDVIGSKIVPLGTKLYTHPPQRTEPLIGCVNHDCAKCKERTWVGLTEDEMYELCLSADEQKDRMAFGKAVEAELKEKNCL
jgi:hypothetical protein